MLLECQEVKDFNHYIEVQGTRRYASVGSYLKMKNPNVKIWGVDTYGSVFKKYHETGQFRSPKLDVFHEIRSKSTKLISQQKC